jgi:hypothetical protein
MAVVERVKNHANIERYDRHKRNHINNHNQTNCTVDPRWKLVTERVDDVLKIKWCNGFGDKVKVDPLGDLIGTNPMTKDGKYIPPGTSALMVF